MTTPEHYRAELVADIVRLGQDINDMTDALYVKVYDARELQPPLTWEDIGVLLGITRQAAWQRFTKSGLRDKVKPLQSESLFS